MFNREVRENEDKQQETSELKSRIVQLEKYFINSILLLDIHANSSLYPTAILNYENTCLRYI